MIAPVVLGGVRHAVKALTAVKTRRATGLSFDNSSVRRLICNQQYCNSSISYENTDELGTTCIEGVQLGALAYFTHLGD